MQAIVNARIYTMDGAAPVANSMLIDAGRIRWVGHSDTPELDMRARGALEIHDFGSDVVIPGLVDAHTHLEQIANSLYLSVDCRSSAVSSIEDIVATIRETAAGTPGNQWIFAQGEHYQELKLAEGRLPDRFDLDRASSDHPIVYRSSYHTNVFNSAALEELGVSKDTPDAPGGRIEHDERGELTGRTYDMYAALGGPESPVEALEAAIADVQHSYLSLGVTSIGDIPLHRNGYEAVRRLDADGKLSLRVALYPKVPTVIPQNEMAAVCGEPTSGNARSSLAGFKVFLDGGLTAGAAALYDAYPDKPDFCGDLLYTQEELCDLIEACEKSGHQLAIHAIGDRALDHLLTAFESYVQSHTTLRVRHRLEHAGNIFLTADRQERVRRLGVIAVPQPSFLLTTADGYRAYLGDRIDPVMPFRSMLEAGLAVPGSSDAIGITPTQHHPFPAMDAAITRLSRGGESLGKDESISAQDALLMYTRHAATALGWEKEVGVLAPEARADFVRLGADPIEQGVFEGTKVLQTWIGGEIAYTA